MEESATNTSDVPNEVRGIVGITVPAALLVLIIVLSAFGNLAVIIAIMKTPRLRAKTSNIFLINLSLTDLMNATLVMPGTLISLIADDWLLGTQWCYAQCALNYCFIIVSMLTLAMISIDGYYAVIHPMHYRNIITPKVTKFAICYAWLQGCIFALIPAIYRWVVYDYWEVVCAIDWDTYSQDGALTFVTIAFIVCFLVPMVIMCFCYFKISCAVRNSGGIIPQISRGTDRRKRQDAKIIKSLAVVVCVFFICMAPFCLTKVLKIFLGTHSLPPPINLASSWFAYLASATNPFIYGIFRPNFRRAFMRLFCGKRMYPPVLSPPPPPRDNQGVGLSHL